MNFLFYTFFHPFIAQLLLLLLLFQSYNFNVDQTWAQQSFGQDLQEHQTKLDIDL